MLSAGGKLSAMKADVAEARYPKKVRDLAKLEADAVELGAYGNHNIHGLLQTEEYARALFAIRRPVMTADDLDRFVAARLSRQEIFEPDPRPRSLSSRKRSRCDGPSGAEWCCGGQLNTCWTWAIAQRRDPGDADGPRGPCWDGR